MPVGSSGGRFWAAKETFNEHEDVALTVDDTDYPAVEIDCEQFSYFLLMYDLTETGVLVGGDRVRLQVQFREAGGTWRTYMNGPFGSLFEAESTTPCSLCVSGICVGERMRIVATTDYTNAAPANNYFTLTSIVTLMR